MVTVTCTLVKGRPALSFLDDIPRDTNRMLYATLVFVPSAIPGLYLPRHDTPRGDFFQKVTIRILQETNSRQVLLLENRKYVTLFEGDLRVRVR